MPLPAVAAAEAALTKAIAAGASQGRIAMLRVGVEAAKAGESVEGFLEKYGYIQNWLLVSDAIREIWYHPMLNILWINFNKVKQYPKYRFEGVPGDVVAGLVNSSSAGVYYHQNIKGKYQSNSIRGPEDDDSIQIRPQVGNLL